MLNSMFVCICVGVCARECSCQWRQKEGSKPLAWVGVTVNRELPSVGAGLNLRLLQEQYMA